MFKAKYKVYLWIYINISSICKNNTVNHLKFGQQLFGFNTEGKSLMMKSSPEHCSVQGQTEAERACRLLYKQSEQKSKNVQLIGAI